MAQLRLRQRTMEQQLVSTRNSTIFKTCFPIIKHECYICRLEANRHTTAEIPKRSALFFLFSSSSASTTSSTDRFLPITSLAGGSVPNRAARACSLLESCSLKRQGVAQQLKVSNIRLE